LADKSEFGWKTVEEYTQHELPDDEKKIRQAVDRAEKAVKSLSNKKFKKQSTFHPPRNGYSNARVPHQMSMQTVPRQLVEIWEFSPQSNPQST
jgi:hypothetical protein